MKPSENTAMRKYESVFSHASFQFFGHVDEYLIANTRHLTLVRFQTRFGKGGHRLERYECGTRVEARTLPSSGNIVLYYVFCVWHHMVELRRHIARTGKTTVVLTTHPLGCFGSTLQRVLGKVKYAFWPWDWFPPMSLPFKIYAAIVRHYIKRVDYPFALTDRIAEKLGGNIPVVMLGMKRLPCANTNRTGSNRILVVGQLRHGQGVENVLAFIADNPRYSLTLLGAAAKGFEHEIHRIIREKNMQDRVDFPNRFVSQEELSNAAEKCFCGLALYDTAGDNFTHYADPGKVKSYLEMGLPVVMTRISGIVPHVETFKAGEVIDSMDELPLAVLKIFDHPKMYFDGVRNFTDSFAYETYYEKNLRLSDAVKEAK